MSASAPPKCSCRARHGRRYWARHRSGSRQENLTDHGIDAAEQGLVLQLLIAEPHQRFERNLVAECVIAAQLQDLGVDKPLDQPKDIGVSASLNLAHKASFIRR